MKKVFVLLILAIAWSSLPALDLDFGLQFGLRTASGKIQDTYGGGTVFFPSLKLNVWKGLGIGLGYELGYKKEAPIGLYKENSTLQVEDFEFFAAYELQAGKVIPYARLGVGSYKYSQNIESTYVLGFKESKTAVSLGVGLKYLISKIFLSAELKYAPLKVQPLTEEVDLGGLRLLAGVGYRIGL